MRKRGERARFRDHDVQRGVGIATADRFGLRNRDLSTGEQTECSGSGIPRTARPPRRPEIRCSSDLSISTCPGQSVPTRYGSILSISRYTKTHSAVPNIAGSPKSVTSLTPVGFRYGSRQAMKTATEHFRDGPGKANQPPCDRQGAWPL